MKKKVIFNVNKTFFKKESIKKINILQHNCQITAE